MKKRWKRPSGSEIEVNCTDAATVEYLMSLGWKPAEKPAKKPAKKKVTKRGTKRA